MICTQHDITSDVIAFTAVAAIIEKWKARKEAIVRGEIPPDKEVEEKEEEDIYNVKDEVCS